MRYYKIPIAAGPALHHLKVGGTGEVHSVFSRTFNILLSGRLIGILSEREALNPISVRSDIPPNVKMLGLVKKGMPVVIVGNSIKVGEVELDFQDVSVWVPQTRVNSIRKEEVSKNLRIVKRIVTNVRKSGGFVQLLRNIDGLSVESPDTPGLSHLCREAKPKIVSLISKIKNMEDVEVEISGLVGLGSGLTPSGDDFLCGFAASIVWTVRSGSGNENILGKIEKAIKKHSRATNLLSSQLLEHALRGEVDERVERFLKAMFGESDENLRFLTEQVVRIGETSGVDMLLGLMLGMEVGLGFIGSSI